MKVTRAEVAKAAGVSTATVSNVLNHSPKVKAETARHVRQVIEQLDYRPDMIARSLSTKRTMQLGIVLEDISNPFFGEIAKSFERAANEKNYFVNICTGFNNLDAYFDNFIARRLDGVFVTALPHKFNTEKLYLLVEKGIKIVTSGNIEVDTNRISSIENDFGRGIWLAMEYLYQLGHRRIAYLSGLGRQLSNDVRCITYKEALEKLNLDTQEDLLVDGKYPYTTMMLDGYQCALRLLKSGKRFTAVICCNDMMAMGAMRAFKENGLEIPRDVSVIGIDGSAIGEYSDPPLTTIAIDQGFLGRKAFELLYENMMEGTVGYYKNEISLKVRGSSSTCKEMRR